MNLLRIGQGAEYYRFIESVVEKHRQEIFNISDSSLTIKKIVLSGKINAHPLSYGRLLTVRYDFNGNLREKIIYLKFRKNYKQVPDKYMEIYHRFSDEQQFLPKFYFHDKFPKTDESVIGMELVDGKSLRSVFFSKMLMKKTTETGELFFKNGQIMRLFHDAQSPQGNRPVLDVLVYTKERLNSSKYFSETEKSKILNHLKNIEESIEPTLALPLIHIHHDWSLRNIFVNRFNRIKMIDLDAYNRSLEWRWNDFAYFLINLESQIKYAPLIREADLNFLWEQFFSGYFSVGEDWKLTEKLLMRLIYLLKVYYWVIPYSLDEYYNHKLGKKYVKKLKESLVAGKVSFLYNFQLGSNGIAKQPAAMSAE